MAYVIVRVAVATGRDVAALALASYAVTLWTFLQLEEIERLRAVKEERDRLDVAGLTAAAFHEPHRLEIREQRFLSRVGALPSREEAMRRAFELDRRDRELKALNPLPEAGR